MLPREIQINNGTGKKRTFYLYDTYSTREEAKKCAKYHRKKNGTRHYIIEIPAGGILGYVVPHTIQALYLDKTIRIW